MSSTVQIPAATEYFPMPVPRPAQLTALEFIHEAVSAGCQDVVIAAPTGIGKSGIGAGACLWADSFDMAGHSPGGFYLVTQKMLQDQLENDFPRFKERFRNTAGSLKSSIEYPCRQYTTCMAGSLASSEGGQMGKRCLQRINKSCPYAMARTQFVMSRVAVTNYPYLFTEHIYKGELEPRNLIVADECHTLERQITSFVEVLVDDELLNKWAPNLHPKDMPEIWDFTDWLRHEYLSTLKDRLEMMTSNLQASDYANKQMVAEFNKLSNHFRRVAFAVDEMENHPDDWVYWQEVVNNKRQFIAKPISAAPFVPKLLMEMSAIRVYMSAYPGPKDVFCRSLGLDPAGVAWLELDSTFPVENRLIHMATVGSMSRKYQDHTLPYLLKMCETIMEVHGNEKGIIHCHSYALGQKIYDYFRGTGRVLFSTKASERAQHFQLHRLSKEPTVMLSPSIAEGFSFDDDLARFQIIAKVPYPYLGDRQVAARMKLDQDWYTLQTVMTVIQACGRIVRSDTDHGETYILDSDFIRLYQDNSKFFPKWFKDAFKFY